MKIKRVLLVVMLISANLIFTVPDAYACSCVSDPTLTEEDLLRSRLNNDFNQTVFVGTVLEKVDENADEEVISTADPLTILFQVEIVYKGEANETLTLTTARHGASCGYLFNEGRRYLVFVSSRFDTGLCSGNIANPSAEILSVLGVGQLPIPSEPVEEILHESIRTDQSGDSLEDSLVDDIPYEVTPIEQNDDLLVGEDDEFPIWLPIGIGLIAVLAGSGMYLRRRKIAI